MTPGEMDEKTRHAKKDGFAKWLDQPATRMMLSMIPPGERQEVLQTLLQETYNAGFEAGAGKTAGQFFEVIFKGMEKDSRERR